GKRHQRLRNTRMNQSDAAFCFDTILPYPRVGDIDWVCRTDARELECKTTQCVVRIGEIIREEEKKTTSYNTYRYCTMSPFFLIMTRIVRPDNRDPATSAD